MHITFLCWQLHCIYSSFQLSVQKQRRESKWLQPHIMPTVFNHQAKNWDINWFNLHYIEKYKCVPKYLCFSVKKHYYISLFLGEKHTIVHSQHDEWKWGRGESSTKWHNESQWLAHYRKSSSGIKSHAEESLQEPEICCKNARYGGTLSLSFVSIYIRYLASFICCPYRKSLIEILNNMCAITNAILKFT